MQCCSEFDLEIRKLLKELLPKYFKKIDYQSVFIPSFVRTGYLPLQK
jgi:hypothetical protein